VETTNLHHPSNKSTKSPLPLPTGLLTRIAAQFHHIGNSPRDIVPYFQLATTTAATPTSQASPGHKTTTHKQPPDLGSESASFSPAFLALPTAINQRLAEEQLHPYLYLEPKDSSTTVVVNSSGILNRTPPTLVLRVDAKTTFQNYQIHEDTKTTNPPKRQKWHTNARAPTRRPFQVD